MPRFSVIIPTYKVLGYIRDCLESVLNQSFTDIEVIAVDDCSPDGCGAILDEYAARDPRVRAVHLPENVGLGGARNAGAAHATGDYLLFLDSDDGYTPGALQAMADRLAEAGDVDVLFFDHVRTTYRGWGGRSDAADLLEAGTDVFTIRERPEYLHVFLTAWNKAFRREFFMGAGLTYHQGLYEDAPVTYQALVLAERLTCLPRICIEYRQGRPGAITRTPGREHFHIFDQYGWLMDFLESEPSVAWSRPLLFERVVNHFLSVLATPARVRAEDRRDFYELASEFYRRHCPPGFTVAADHPRQAEFKLLATQPFGVFDARTRLSKQLRTVVKKRNQLRKEAGRKVRQFEAHLVARQAVDPTLVMYGAFDHRGVLGDPAAVYRKAREIAPHLRGVWVVRRDRTTEVPPGVETVTLGSREYEKLSARAGFLVNNVNWPDRLVKREGSIHVHTHQGTPLKHMGMDLKGNPAAFRGEKLRWMLQRADRWDYSLVANEHSERVWRDTYPCDFTSLRTGSPRNDVLVNATAEDVRAARERLGLADGRKVVLYAPTYRDYKSGYVDLLDLRRLAEGLGDDYRLAVRLHRFQANVPFRKSVLRDLVEAGLAVDLTDYPHVEDVLLASDALISDYSALLCDFALLDRPILIQGDDLLVYQQTRGLYLDLTTEGPGPVSYSLDQTLHLIRRGIWDDDESARRRAAFRARFGAYEDGRAAERVVRQLFLHEPATTVPPTRSAVDDRLPAGVRASVETRPSVEIRSAVPAQPEPEPRPTADVPAADLPASDRPVSEPAIPPVHVPTQRAAADAGTDGVSAAESTADDVPEGFGAAPVGLPRDHGYGQPGGGAFTRAFGEPAGDPYSRGFGEPGGAAFTRAFGAPADDREEAEESAVLYPAENAFAESAAAADGDFGDLGGDSYGDFGEDPIESAAVAYDRAFGGAAHRTPAPDGAAADGTGFDEAGFDGAGADPNGTEAGSADSESATV